MLTLELDNAPQVSRFGPLMAESSINYEGARGPHVMCKWALGNNGNIKVWYAAWLNKFWKKKVIWRERRRL